MGNQRAREREAAGGDSGPQTAAKVARALHTRPPSVDPATGPPAGPGNAALARAHGVGVLPKLTVSHPDDELEREAEEFSTKVVARTPVRSMDTSAVPAESATARMAVARRSDTPGAGPQRTAKPAVAQRWATLARDDAPAGPAAESAAPAPDMSGAEVGGGLESFITGISGGEPLAEDLRARIEPVLGADLTGVRVHRDGASAAAAAELQARAFTFGKDIFLGAGESPADLALMAHEATHVVQQGAVEILRDLFTTDTDADTDADPAPAVSIGEKPTLARSLADAFREDDDSGSFLMGPIKSAARAIPGYVILSQIIGEDPLTGDPVQTGRAEFVQALLAYGPFAGAVGPVLQTMDALDEIFTMVTDRLAAQNFTLARIKGDIDKAWEEIHLIDGIDANVAIVTRYVDALIADVRAFVNAVVDEVIAALKAAAIEFAKPLVQRPEIKPYWDLGTKVFHYDPLTGEGVSAPTVEILGDFLRLIGKEDVVNQMTERGTLQETADWLDTQIATFGDLYTQTRALITDVIDALSPANLPSLITNIESIADRALSLLQQFRTFAETVITKVLELVKHSLLGMLSEHAKKVPGYTLLTVILEQDPFTEERVERTAENLIKGFILLLPNGEQMYTQLAESGAIAEAAGRIEGEMTRLNISWELITGTFKAIWDGLKLEDLLDPIGAFQRILDQFGEPLGRIVEFAATVIQVIVELILKMMNFPSELLGNIVSNAMAAIDDIQKDPVGFLQNVIEALKQGVTGFFDNIGPYLLDGLVDWLFRGLRSLGIQPPESLSLESVITLVIQVVGVTEETLWKKLADRTSPETVAKIRGAIELAGQAFSFIKDVQERGVTAIWEFIQGQLSNLWDTILGMAKDWIMSEIITKVTTRLLSMLDPTGIMAVIRSAQAFFNAIQSAIEYITEILQIVDRYVSTIAAIAQGNVGPGAAMLEQGLASAIPIAIGFLANQIGLGDVPEKIRDIILGLRELIDRALDWLFDQAIRLGQAALNALGLGGEGEDADGDQGSLSQATAPFHMDGADHTLTVVETGGSFELMMSSSPGVLVGRVYYAINDPATPAPVKGQLQTLNTEITGVYEEMKTVLAGYKTQDKMAAPVLAPGEPPMRRRVYLTKLATWVASTGVKLEALGNANHIKDLVGLGHKSKYVGPDGMILPAYQDWRKEFYGGWQGGTDSFYWKEMNDAASTYWNSIATPAQKAAANMADFDLYQCADCKQYFSDSTGFGGYPVRKWQLDHEPPVLEHFRTHGKAMTQEEREDWYSDKATFTGVCNVCNSSYNRGMKKLQGDFRVKRRFRGDGDNPPDPATDNEDAMDP